MNKKILDAVMAAAFCFCLITTSNIQESNTESVQAAVKENDVVSAGVCRVLSQHSFTTESDEKTDIEKNECFRVTVPENALQEEDVPTAETENEIETVTSAGNTEEDAGQTVIPAGLAQTDAPQETQEAAAMHLNQNRWNINLTEDEVNLLAQIVWLEANGEPVEGQEAVVEVVFNRMTSGLYPNQLYDVLSQKNPVQFCSWKNREIAKPTEKEYQSIYEVLNGNTNILRNDTMYFSTHALTSNIDKKIGGHHFCY